jgi:ABC-type multidrug transport system ATPase subunit
MVNAANSDGAAPTLELRQFAPRSSSATWLAPLTIRSHARRVALVGDWEPLFDVLGGRSEAASGHATILGCALEFAISRGILGFAACDPPLPGSFSVTEYLQHAARLTHGSTSRASLDAKRALDRYGLSELAKRKLSELALYQRRALGIALATLTEPAVACLEAPLRGLDAPSADYIARLCVEAAAHGRLLLSAGIPSSPSPERSLLDACDELFVLDQGVLVAQGAPSVVFAAGSRYILQVTGDKIPDFVSALSALGMRVDAHAQAGKISVELPSSSNGSTDPLLDTALDHGLVVLELQPIFVGRTQPQPSAR